MESIQVISITDFNEKIHYYISKPSLDLEENLKILKSLNRKLKVNIIQECITKNIPIKLIDTTVNKYTRVKITVVGDIILCILFNSSIDIFTINSINQRLIEAMHNLIRATKIKIELLNKKQIEMNHMLTDVLCMIDPFIRLNIKSENLNSNVIIN